MSAPIYPGSFDPFTLGHHDILNRTLDIFGEVCVAVAKNIGKRCLFSEEARINMIKKACKYSDKVEVVQFDTLITDFLKVRKSRVLIRGIRDANDFLYESKMSRMNKILYPQMDTLFLHTDERFAHISSSLVKEIAILGGDISHLVPEELVEEIKASLK